MGRWLVTVLSTALATAVASDVLRLSAFSNDATAGGNPAGVLVAAAMPDVPTMQRIAAEVGYSETVFAALEPSSTHWRVRYFAPESEVSFCTAAWVSNPHFLRK